MSEEVFDLTESKHYLSKNVFGLSLIEKTECVFDVAQNKQRFFLFEFLQRFQVFRYSLIVMQM